VQNLNEPYLDCTGRLAELLTPGCHVFAYGIFYSQAGDLKFEAKVLVFPGESPDAYRHEEPDWWVSQVTSIADCYLKWQFGYPEQEIDYANYRTMLHLAGAKKQDDYLQETDTISRMVYGMASTYLLTGEDRFLEAAEKGTEYLRDHMRFYDPDEDLIYWYHGVKVTGNREQKLFTSEFGDDYDAIPAYEQIYALAGPIQTYRITGDPRILRDAEMTVDLFDKFYIDKEQGGYFSHLDPLTLDPKAESLKWNQGRKNWNSVGDHAPAYLINLVCAIEPIPAGSDAWRGELVAAASAQELCAHGPFRVLAVRGDAGAQLHPHRADTVPSVAEGPAGRVFQVHSQKNSRKKRTVRWVRTQIRARSPA
jgi:hypothetical protein